MNTIEITKIKIKNSLADIWYDEIYEDNNREGKYVNGAYLIHKDFQDAMDAFKPHFAKLLDLREGDIIKRKIEDFHEEAFSNLVISGLTFGGIGDDFGVCIVGTKTIRGGKVIPQNTPFEKVFDDNSDYKFRDHLNDCILRAKYEAEEYIVNKKHRIGQMSIDYQDQAKDME